MGMQQSAVLILLVINTLLHGEVTQSEQNVGNSDADTPQLYTQLVFDYNCHEKKNMTFDTNMLPSDYHAFTNFTIQNCDEVDFATTITTEALNWEVISFRRIKRLRLRLTQLPVTITSIDIEDVNLDSMSFDQTQLLSTVEIRSLVIKNSVLKNISTDTFSNPMYHNIVFHNVTFHTIFSDALIFKFDEDSTFEILRTVFLNNLPSNAITVTNATHINVEETRFASRLKQNSVQLRATEDIKIKNVSFSKLLKESLQLSAPIVELRNNSFYGIAANSIVLNYPSELAITGNAFHKTVDSPLHWEHSNNTGSPEFVGNSFLCGTSYDSEETQGMVNTLEQFASNNNTFCGLLKLNSCNKCDSDTKALLKKIRENKNCTSSSGNFNQLSIVGLAVNVAIFKISQL